MGIIYQLDHYVTFFKEKKKNKDRTSQLTKSRGQSYLLFFSLLVLVHLIDIGQADNRRKIFQFAKSTATIISLGLYIT